MVPRSIDGNVLEIMSSDIIANAQKDGHEMRKTGKKRTGRLDFFLWYLDFRWKCNGIHECWILKNVVKSRVMNFTI
jgi:hypothetical protein